MYRLARFRIALKLAELSVEEFAYEHLDRTGSIILRHIKKHRHDNHRSVMLQAVDRFIREEFAKHPEILDLKGNP